jgi:hypothetical protein
LTKLYELHHRVAGTNCATFSRTTIQQQEPFPAQRYNNENLFEPNDTTTTSIIGRQVKSLWIGINIFWVHFVLNMLISKHRLYTRSTWPMHYMGGSHISAFHCSAVCRYRDTRVIIDNMLFLMRVVCAGVSACEKEVVGELPHTQESSVQPVPTRPYPLQLFYIISPFSFMGIYGILNSVHLLVGVLKLSNSFTHL